MLRFIASALTLLISATYAPAADDVAVETILSKLAHPCGIAVRPGDSAEAFEVFVAETGALRVVRTASTEKDNSMDVVIGFDDAPSDDGPLRAGPIGLLFLDRNRLAVGCRNNDGNSYVRVYTLTDPARELSADKSAQQVTVAADGEADRDARHVYALARTRANEKVPDALIVTLLGDSSGELKMMPLRAGTLGEPQSFGESSDFGIANRPTAVTVATSGFVVVAHAGAFDNSRDSRLVYCNPIDRTRIMEVVVDLRDLVGLAYSPKTGNLYAVDMAWTAPDEGGIYRIDDAGTAGEQRAVAVKVADVARPTALAFGPDGALYVTALGTDDETNTGVLLKLTGEL